MRSTRPATHVPGRRRHGDPALPDQHLLQRLDRTPRRSTSTRRSTTCPLQADHRRDHLQPTGTTFTIAQIVASVDQGMFQHMMGNDPRPHYFHQTNLMNQSTGIDRRRTARGLFYETLNPLLTQYNSYFASNAPIEQLTMAQIGTLLSEQSGWAAPTQPDHRLHRGQRVTVKNNGAATEIPLTGHERRHAVRRHPVRLDATRRPARAPTPRWRPGLPADQRRSS